MRLQLIVRNKLIPLALGLLILALPGDASTRRVDGVGPRSAGLRLASSGSGISDNPAVRAAHTCAVIADGTVRCWGSNDSGQLGNGSNAPSSNSPVTVTVTNGSVLGGVMTVAAGRHHACGLRFDGTVFCWGANDFGQLGQGSTSLPVRRAVAVQSGGFALSSVSMIAAGTLHTCALRSDGTVRCWGSNSDGQAGGQNRTATPTQIVDASGNALTGVSSIAAGGNHTCAIQQGGVTPIAFCWGSNRNGQLGNGAADAGAHQFPSRVSFSDGTEFTDAIALVAGEAHTCATRINGSIHCWGRNAEGQIGNGTTTDALNPVSIIGSNVVGAGAGAFHSCAVLLGGTARCWGLNDQGQLGNNQTGGSRLAPVTVTSTKLSTAVAITAGGSHSCARRVDDSVRCWGANGSGQLGNATNAGDDEPVPVTGIDATPLARAIAAGSQHSCALRASGEVACWGTNTFGQLGNNNQNQQLTPVAVRDGADPTRNLSGVLAVTTGGQHSCALQFGTVLCWGRNSELQLGATTTGNFSAIPVAVGGLTDAVAVAAGFFHTCALRVTGTVRCWGRNNQGQLGNGTTDNSVVPVTVSRAPTGTLNDVVGITGGANQSCALHGNGSVSCWGSSQFGQLGNDTSATTSLRAVSAFNLPDATAIAVSPIANHNCALRPDSTMRCWGRNFEGQLGDGTTTNRDVPTPGTIAGLVALTGGAGHSCAIGASGMAVCWGVNSQGQLGDGTTTTPAPPAPVTVAVGTFTSGGQVQRIPLAGLGSIAAGGAHTCSVLVNGLPMCWGDNAAGQLGEGTGSDRLFATQVPSFTFNVAPAVTLIGNDRVAMVDALALCEAGDEVHIQITLTQGDVTGEGQKTARCTSTFASYEVAVSARGRDGFSAGPATAVANAVVRRNGEVVNDPQWTRIVQLAPQ